MTESLRILLTRLIDYAGLFPPASLSMKVSVDNFHEYREGPHAWMLNRFVVPAARLQEFLRDFELLPKRPHGASPWKLTVIAGADVESDLDYIREFNRVLEEGAAPAVIESIEIKAADPEAITHYAGLVPRSFESYFELPRAGGVDGCIAALAKVGARAKLRTGGSTAEMYPSCRELAHFLAVCASANVPVKFSAGLHHPIRSVHSYTYERDSPLGIMHGFLNVFVAAAFAHRGVSVQEVERILAEESPKTLEFTQTGVRCDEYSLMNQDLVSARNSFCISFGSCSFIEPIDGLCGLGLL
jgi:hypothetical protein